MILIKMQTLKDSILGYSYGQGRCREKENES